MAREGWECAPLECNAPEAVEDRRPAEIDEAHYMSHDA